MAPARRLLSLLVVATLAAVALVAWQGAELQK